MAKCYQTFKEDLMSMLSKLFYEAMLPTLLYEASITLISELDKDTRKLYTNFIDEHIATKFSNKIPQHI
jgi:hypothetical protein